MASTYRDRTSEFRSLTETLKKIGGGGGGATSPPNQQPSTSQNSYSRSEFNRKASQIGFGIHETSQKIARLAKLAKQSSMFNDPIMEIQELTALIKTDITTLNAAVLDLQNIQKIDLADEIYSEDRVVHSNAVCDDLKNKLMGATKHLQDVLTTRTENIKAHENRRQIFSNNPLQHQPKSTTEPPPWSNSTNAFETESLQQTSGLPSNGIPVGNQLSTNDITESAFWKRETQYSVLFFYQWSWSSIRSQSVRAPKSITTFTSNGSISLIQIVMDA